MKFQEIVKHHIDSIYGGGWDNVRISEYLVITLNEMRIRGKYNYTSFSLNDLLSPESGFLQACKWKSGSCSLSRYQMIGDSGGVRDDNTCQYNSMMLSILPDKDKITYLENHVIVE